MKNYLLYSIVLLMGTNTFAQDVYTDTFTDTIISPQFFITVIAGVILALGFQFILTALSVAAGITAIGDVKKTYVKSKNHTSVKHDFKDSNDNDDDDNSGSTGTMVTTAFGIWSTLTVAISLFGATAFAMNLSLVANPLIAVTLALVIWATFFIMLFYLETKVVNTFVGGLINAATSGLRSSASAVKDMFSTSEASKVEHVADHTIEKVRKEFQNVFDSNMLDSAVDEFFTKFDKKVPNYDKVKSDIEKIVDDSVEKSNKQSSSDSSGGSSPGKWMAVQSVLNNAIGEASDDSSEEGKSKTEQLKKLQKELKEAYGEGDNKEEKVQKVVAKLTPAEEEQVGSYIDKIKNFISTEGSGEMNSQSLDQRVKEIVKNPKVEANKIGQKMEDLDRDTIVKLVSQNTSMDRMQAEKYADKVEKTIRRVQVELNGNAHNDGVVTEIKEQIQSILSGLGSGSSDFNFSDLTNIIQNKMDNQKDSLEVIKSRLQNSDKDDVIALITNNTKIDRKDIDKVANSVEDARNNVLNRIQKIEDTAKGRLKMVERKAVIQAEHARETAASAAWWLVVSAVFSACAAIGGSLLTLF
ncbi:hypothetical protein [uncultured Christiangramia sp.]|uniref:hypothetical protein n=1 Tax=Christiangramia sp. 3-2217-3z TaxID=3417564 RepID=UPI0026119F22|nr:hypothetical protein [uncultured Christiangramia sp.]